MEKRKPKYYQCSFVFEGDTLAKSKQISGVSPVVDTFFGATPDLRDAEYVFVGVPFDGTSTYRKGAKAGPAAIRAASQQIESFCLQEDPHLDAAKLPIADIGNIIIKPDTVQEMLQSIETTVAMLLQNQQIPILLGGEHTLALGALRALPRDVVVIQFDAHMDLRDEFGGSPFSHACVQRRIVEQLGADHIVQIGIRAVSQEEYEYAQEQNIVYYTVEEIHRQGAETIAKYINDTITPGPPLYISIDMDVLDPAYAPAVGNPEAGGLTTSDVITVLRLLAPRATLFDINEIAPQFDQGITAICAARIVTTFLCSKAKTLLSKFK